HVNTRRYPGRGSLHYPGRRCQFRVDYLQRFSDQPINHWTLWPLNLVAPESIMSTTETIPTPAQAIGDPNAPVVSFEHVSIGFDGHSVLLNISFQARSGEMVIILGPAGGG